MFETIFTDVVNKTSWPLSIDESLDIQRGIYTLTIYLVDEENDYKKLTKSYEIVVR